MMELVAACERGPHAHERWWHQPWEDSWGDRPVRIDCKCARRILQLQRQCCWLGRCCVCPAMTGPESPTWPRVAGRWKQQHGQSPSRWGSVNTCRHTVGPTRGHLPQGGRWVVAAHLNWQGHSPMTPCQTMTPGLPPPPTIPRGPAVKAHMLRMQRQTQRPSPRSHLPAPLPCIPLGQGTCRHGMLRGLVARCMPLRVRMPVMHIK